MSKIIKSRLRTVGLFCSLGILIYALFGISASVIPLPGVYKESVELRLSNAAMRTDWSARASAVLEDGSYTLADWYELQVEAKPHNQLLAFIDRTNLGVMFYICPLCVGPMSEFMTTLK